MKKILVTGAAGFIGFFVCRELLNLGFTIYGIDNLNDYYDVSLKMGRLKELGISAPDVTGAECISDTWPGFTFSKTDLADEQAIDALFNAQKFDIVINLAAQAGVRYSIENPKVYVQSNIVGFINILEACRNTKVQHLIYASSSSVYGNQEKVPFSETDNVDHPVSLYAATKKSNELMAHTYSHLYSLKTTGLRFFTVYGPWGRPDMAPFLFTKAILAGHPIKVFNNGDLMRDFTYIDDIVSGIIKVALADDAPAGDVPYRLFNIGNNRPAKLMEFINAIEHFCGREAIKDFQPMQPGDVYKTYADIDALGTAVGYEPSTALHEGIGKFVAWYKGYYGQ